jgi:hypothetical protein
VELEQHVTWRQAVKMVERVGHRAGRVLISTWRRYHDGSTRRVLGWALGCCEVRRRSSAFLTKIIDE